jgi:predicted transcriptional regulator
VLLKADHGVLAVAAALSVGSRFVSGSADAEDNGSESCIDETIVVPSHSFDRKNAMSESLDRGYLLKLTSKVVSAYVSCHRVAPTELEFIIGSVAGSLAEVGDPPQAVPARAEPAVLVRRSVGKNHLICLVCGQKQKMLKRHLATRHQLSPVDYRERYDLSSDYPLVAPSYAAQRSELARRIGLGRKPTMAEPTAAPRKQGPTKRK